MKHFTEVSGLELMNLLRIIIIKHFLDVPGSES